MDRARLLVSNCCVKNSCSFIPIFIRSGVVDLEIITWKISHFKSPWTNISLDIKNSKKINRFFYCQFPTDNKKSHNQNQTMNSLHSSRHLHFWLAVLNRKHLTSLNIIHFKHRKYYLLSVMLESRLLYRLIFHSSCSLRSALLKIPIRILDPM